MFHSENLKTLCELRSGPYIVTKVITKVNCQIALDADPTRTEVVHRNHVFEYFPRDNELPNLLSSYEKPFNDDKTEHFYNENAKYRLSQLNQPVDSFVERQHLNDYSLIFPDTCEPSRMDTIIKSPVKDNSWHSTPNFLTNSLDSGFPQSSLNTPISYQWESLVTTSQPTTPSPLFRTTSFNPTNLPSTNTGTSPRSTNAGTLRNIQIFLASGTESILLNFLSSSATSFSINYKNLKKTRQVIPDKTYAIQRICIFHNFINLTTTSGVSVEIQPLVFLHMYNIWCFRTITTFSDFHFS